MLIVDSPNYGSTTLQKAARRLTPRQIAPLVEYQRIKAGELMSKSALLALGLFQFQLVDRAHDAYETVRLRCLIVTCNGDRQMGLADSGLGPPSAS